MSETKILWESSTFKDGGLAPEAKELIEAFKAGNADLDLQYIGNNLTAVQIVKRADHPADTIPVTMDMDADAYTLLNDIADHSGSKANAIREALSLYAHVLKERADGGKLIIEKGDTRREVIPFSENSSGKINNEG